MYSFFCHGRPDFLGTNTTTTKGIPTKPTTLSPVSTTRAAGKGTYYWNSRDFDPDLLFFRSDDGFSIMTSFFSELVHTHKGATCSDSGFVDLSTAQECSDAVSYAKFFNSKANYRFEVEFDLNPKGCYIELSKKYPRLEGFMYFNQHSTGSRCSSCISICLKSST